MESREGARGIYTLSEGSNSHEAAEHLTVVCVEQ